jgi:hypothetical protein
MRIIVSDTSCIIDLGKGRLIRATLKLPYSFVMPDVLFENELIDFGPIERGSYVALASTLLNWMARGLSGRWRVLRDSGVP